MRGAYFVARESVWVGLVGGAHVEVSGVRVGGGWFVHEQSDAPSEFLAHGLQQRTLSAPVLIVRRPVLFFERRSHTGTCQGLYPLLGLALVIPLA